MCVRVCVCVCTCMCVCVYVHVCVCFITYIAILISLQATLSVELIPNDDRHQLFQVNSLSLSTMTHVLAAEWSHSMFTAVSHLLKHYSTPKGILKKQQALSKPDSVISDTEDSTNTKQSVVSKHLKIPWCSLREDLEELDISFNFLDINLFMYDKSPSDPSLLLRIDGCCVKTPEVYSGSIEDFMLAVHCNSLILLPFSVDHLIEVCQCVCPCACVCKYNAF